jgi:hypothetical protein
VKHRPSTRRSSPPTGMRQPQPPHNLRTDPHRRPATNTAEQARQAAQQAYPTVALNGSRREIP